MVFEIPKKFNIVCHTITVRQDKDDTLDDLGAHGAWVAQRNEILIRSTLPPTRKFQTFCHELEHAVQRSMGIGNDEHDEKEVDLRGSLLAQALLSFKGTL